MCFDFKFPFIWSKNEQWTLQFWELSWLFGTLEFVAKLPNHPNSAPPRPSLIAHLQNGNFIFARNLKSSEVLPWFPLLGLWGYFQLIGAGNQHFPKLGSSFIFLLPLPGSHRCHCSEYWYPQSTCSHFQNYQNHLHEPQIQLQVLISGFDHHHHERRLFLMSGWSILTIYLLAHPASTQPNYLRPNASGSRRPRSHWSTAPTGSTNQRAVLHLAGGCGRTDDW